MTKFAPVTLEELYSITNSFKDGKAPGADNIPISIIKKSIAVISDPLLSLTICHCHQVHFLTK